MLIYDVFGIPVPAWSDNLLVALTGDLATQGSRRLPSLVQRNKSPRLDLLDNYHAILFVAFIAAGLPDALVNVSCKFSLFFRPLSLCPSLLQKRPTKEEQANQRTGTQQHKISRKCEQQDKESCNEERGLCGLISLIVSFRLRSGGVVF